ncbi:MAG: MFS transporter [Candidatus Methylomirabilales bacterium]
MTAERGAPAPRADKPAPLLSRSFLYICLATSCFYLSFYLILPVMPLYVASLGGTSTQIGLIIGYFAAMAMLMRPPAGWLIDTRGHRPILLAGMAVFLLASAGYVVTPSVSAILALRVFHGIGMGLFPTAATVVVAELAPLHRRGEAMGWFGVANSVGLLVGPLAGPWIAARFGFAALFLLAAAVAGAGMGCLLALPRPAPRPAPRVPRPGDFFSRAAVLPSGILLFLYVPYGAVVAFIPLIATARGLENPGIFYMVYAVAMLLVRAKAGEVSDGRGRAAVIIPGSIVAAAAMAVLGATSGSGGVLLAAALLGAGVGAVLPAVMALTTDRAGLADRGKAMGTFYTAWEAGIALGAAASGWLLTVTDFGTLFLGVAAMPLLGAALAVRARRGPAEAVGQSV